MTGQKFRRPRPLLRTAIVLCALVAFSSSLSVASEIFVFTHSSGLAAEVEFTLIDPTTLEVRARNISTGVPLVFDAADQLLTGVSWDFGHPGFNGDAMITGGSVVTGASSASQNFSVSNVGANADVSGEYGYGNMDGTGALTNFVSGNAAQATPFGGPNLDGPVVIDGPQAGLIAASMPVPLGGLGAIKDEFVATLLLDTPLADLDFLRENGVRVEFGSDAAFIPEPSSLMLLALGFLGLAFSRRRRRT